MRDTLCPLRMTTEIQHQCAVALLVDRTGFHDIESAIPKQERRTARETARLRSIQDLDANPNAVRRTQLGRDFRGGDGRALAACADHCTAGHQNTSRQHDDGNPRRRHETAFQSATVSGKSECPSCNDHSSRARTT